MRKLKLIFFIILAIIFISTNASIKESYNSFKLENNIKVYMSDDMMPGVLQFILFKTEKKINYEIFCGGMKFPVFKLWNDKDWYLSWFSVNIPYSGNIATFKIIDKNNNKELFKKIFDMDKYKKKVKNQKYNIIHTTTKMDNLQNDKPKVSDERAVFASLYKIYTTKRIFNFPFDYPVKQPVVSSPFGQARKYIDQNGKIQKIRYHYGTDFRGGYKTKLYSTSNGIVRFASFKPVRGNCVVIDHGYGIFSTYFHMSKIEVKKGDYVNKGDYIGNIGSTGYSTGPHLHWEMRFNHVLVGGLDFIESWNILRKIIYEN